jgi:ParB-like chromosome segregation protein Spo0J
MKDAKGHGSNPRGSHSEGVQQIGGAVHDIPLSKIKPNPTFDLRGWDGDFSKINPKAFQPNMRTAEGNAYTVAKIREAMQRGEQIPPIDLHDGEISEGHHRYVAAKLEGAKTIKAVFK